MHIKNLQFSAWAVMTLVSVSGVFSAYGWYGHQDPIIGDDDIPKAWNYETKNWMKDIPDSAKLGEITLVSSHDAGMNEDRDQDPHVWGCSACQFHSLYEQMRDGARFFDVRFARPYQSTVVFRCWHGVEYGHAVYEVMDDAVRFVTENPSETVVLKISHWWDRDIVTQRKACMQEIMSRSDWTNKFYRSSARPAPLLNQVPLSELRGKVLVLLDWQGGIDDEPVDCYDHKASADLGYTPENGFWKFGEVADNTKGIYGYYRIYDSYAEKLYYNRMLLNQYGKWRDFVKNRDANTNAFMLCWQETFNAVIYDGAKDINPRLDCELKHFIELCGARPGLVNIDYIDRNVCKSVINVNYSLIHPQTLPPVSYLEPQFGGHGEVTGYVTNTLTHYSILDGTFDWSVGLDEFWYVVSTNGCAFDKGADVVENAHARIILRDGTRLTSFHEDFDNGPSIDVEKTGAALTIYGQSTSTNVMGELEVQGDNQGAGIGAGNNHDGKRITINGGKVTARGGKYAAGIGGGNEGSGYDITINGGWVRTYGGENGAGIGGGRNRNGYDIAINGGLVEAVSGGKSAGIGGGYAGEGHDITINGGYTRAVGIGGGAGIGGGEQHNGGGAGYAITVNGGTVDADEVYHAYNLGHGNDGSEAEHEVAITGGSLWANGRGIWECWGLKNPTNSAGQAVYEVTVPEVRSAGLVSVTGLGAYGVNDLQPFDGKLKFYLPNGSYQFSTAEADYEVTVDGAAVTATKISTGVFVNDRDLGKGYGPGWSFANGVLSLTNAQDYVIAGTNTESAICFDITDDAKVTFDGLKLASGNPGRSPVIFSAHNAELVVKGVNTLSADGYIGTILVSNDCGLIVSGDGELDGGAASGLKCRCFTVQTGANFVMNGGTICGYEVQYGGAIRVYGTATINGGVIRGNKACLEAGGSGGGKGGGICVAENGTLTVNGGSIIANTAVTAGPDIYNSGVLRICGGTIGQVAWDSTHEPKNGSDNRVYKVTVQDIAENPTTVFGIDGYGGQNLLTDTDSRRLYLWLQNGAYEFSAAGAVYGVTVDGSDVSAEKISKGVFVNDLDLGMGPGPGWSFANGVLSLTNAQDYVISGSNTTDAIRIDVTANAKVTFDGLILASGNPGRSPIAFAANDAELVLKGVNAVTADDYIGTILVDKNCGLVLSGDGELVGGAASGLKCRCFTVQTGARFVMNGGTIRGYEVQYGGAIRVYGTATINGGMIRDNKACLEQAGEGGGKGGGICVEKDGALTVNGGTIVDNQAVAGGDDIYSGHSVVTVTGGSANLISGSVCDGNGNDVRKVSVPVLDGEPTPVVVIGLDGYGTRDLHPDSDSRLYFWLADSADYAFETRMAIYKVETGGSSAAYSVFQGIRVDDRDIGYGSGSGWMYENGAKLLSLTNAQNYVISGSNTTDAICIDVTANAKVTFDGLTLASGNPGRSPIVFAANDAELMLKGVNAVTADDYIGTILVDKNCGLVLSGDGELVGGAAGGLKCRCFTVQTGARFVMNGGTIRGYEVQYGGAIRVYGTATINGGVIRGNVASVKGADDGGHGGGICVGSGARLTVNGGTIAGNTAKKWGDDIYSDTPQTLNGGNVQNVYSQDQNAPTNGLGEVVYAVTVADVAEGAVAVSGLDGYGVKDLYSVLGSIRLWLPNGPYHFWVDDTRYDVIVDGGAAASQSSTPVDESATYASEEAAQAAAAKSYVARPNDQVAGVVTAEAYDAMFAKKTVARSAGEWGILPELTTETTNEVSQVINSSAVASNLVSTITNAMPVTMVRTTPGLYYGMSSATNVTETGTATPLNWEVGDGSEKEVRGIRPAGATDRAFYQLRVTTQP